MPNFSKLKNLAALLNANKTEVPQAEPDLQQQGSVKNLDNDIQAGTLDEVKRRISDYTTPHGWNGLVYHPPYPLNTEGFLQDGKNRTSLDDSQHALTDPKYAYTVDDIRPDFDRNSNTDQSQQEAINSYVLSKLRNMKLPRQDDNGGPEVIPVRDSSRGTSLGIPGDSDSYPAGQTDQIENEQKIKSLRDLLSKKGAV